VNVTVAFADAKGSLLDFRPRRRIDLGTPLHYNDRREMKPEKVTSVDVARLRRGAAAAGAYLYPSPAVIVCALASCSLLAIGLAVHHFTPLPDKAELEHLFGAFPFDNLRDLVRPEPQEKFAYLAVLLAAPVALASAVVVQRRAHRRRGFGAPWAGLLLLLSIPLLNSDENWHRLIANAASNPACWVLGSVFACVLIFLPVFAPRLDWSHGLAKVLKTAASLALIAFLVALTLCWRIFDMDSLAESGSLAFHYDAVAYSLTQIVKGGTCLYDVIPQYGCYGEFLAPIVNLFGYSTLLVSLLMALLQALAIIFLVAFSRFLIERWLLFAAAAACVALVTNRIIYVGSIDPGFANMPIRLLFPAASLLLVQWQSRQSPARTFGWGAFSAVALLWNLDTGLIVFAALGILVLFDGCTASAWRPRWRSCLAFALGWISILALAAIALSLKAGHVIDPAYYVAFQRTFFGSGFGMLPMPGVSSLWTLVALIYLIPLAMIAVRVGRGPHDFRLERAGYLAVLGAGLFGYYVGRSHTETLMIVIWPAVILAFFLIHRFAQDAGPRPANMWRGAIAALSLSFVAVTMASRTPELSVVRDRWARLSGGPADTSIGDEVAFIKARGLTDEPVGILAVNQATLFGEAGLRSATPGPGWVETLREADVEVFMERLITGGPKHLFIGYNISCCNVYSNWLPRNFETIKALYALAGWNSKGSLMHLVRRGSDVQREDLFRWSVAQDNSESCLKSLVQADRETGTVVGDWKRPVSFPYDTPIGVRSSSFAVELRVRPGFQQPRHATLMSNQCCSFQGVAVHQLGESNSYAVVVGNGRLYETSPAFRLEPGRENTICLQSNRGHVVAVVNGQQVFSSTEVLAPSSFPLTIGGGIVPGRRFVGEFTSMRSCDGLHLPR
jgi:hypothetical protein